MLHMKQILHSFS